MSKYKYNNSKSTLLVSDPFVETPLFLFVVVEICVKAERSKGSSEVIEMTQSVMSDCVTFGVIVYVVSVAVSRNVAGNHRNRNVDVVSVLDLAFVAVIAEDAVVVVVAVLVVVPVTLRVNGGHVNRMDRNDRNVVVGVNVTVVRAAVPVVATVIVVDGTENRSDF